MPSVKIHKTIARMYQNHKHFESFYDHQSDQPKDLEYCNYLPKVDFLQVSRV